MKAIENISGLTVEQDRDNRVVKYNGSVCLLIKQDEVLCKADTSYRGDVLDSWETYKTPIGVVERHYWARGAGLESSGADWRIVPAPEIEAAQRRFETASIEMESARRALEALVSK